MEKLIINAAITGMIPTKEDNPDVPIIPDEIVAEVKRCRDAGASIVHIHAREPDGNPTYKGEIYSEIFDRIRQDCPDILISGSTSGRIFKEFEHRSQVLEPTPGLKPDLASLTLGSLNFPKRASINEPEMIRMLAMAMNERGIVPEWEIFDLGMVDYAHYLISKDILRKPYYCNILLGSLGTLSATPFNLATTIRALPEGTTWSATGIGRYQFFVNSMAVTMGGHVRVGLEDNIWFDIEKTKLATNAGLIDRVVGVAKSVARDVATPEEARELIGLT